MRFLPGVLAAVAVLLIDQLSKLWVLEVLNLSQIGRMEILPPFLVFSLAWNEGINFGLFAGGSDTWRYFLIAAAFGLAGYFVYWSGTSGSALIARISAGILAGGAIGNGIDRIRLGAVVDFLNMSCCGIYNPYAFNLADVAIFAGAAGMLVFGWRKTKAAPE